MKTFDPYRLLFPFGFYFAVIGSLAWLAFYSGFPIPYPASAHASIMMGAFQFCFAAGFLMTAIPRFTGTGPASAAELLLSGILALALAITALISLKAPTAEPAFHVAGFTLSLFLAWFFLRRFLTRTHQPPSSFFFVAIGMGFAILGNAFLFIARAELIEHEVFDVFGRAFLHHGLMLSLVLGVGARLVTSNLGWMQNPIIPFSSFLNGPRPRLTFAGFVKSSYGSSLILATIFLLSFPIEILLELRVGRGLRAAVATWIGFSLWRLHRMPLAKTRIAFWLWVCCWSIVAGLWIYAIVPPWAVAGAHLSFISGYSLMIFMIASRVTLSHGGYDLDYERTSPVYAVTGVLTVIAALLRFLSVEAPRFSAMGLPHALMGAAAAFLLCLAIWGHVFVRKMIRINK